MRILNMTRITVVLLAWIALGVAADDLAYVRSASDQNGEDVGGQGSAWLFNRGGACYAVTPRHILQDADRSRDDRYARVVVVRPGRLPKEAQADRCAVLKDLDLALIRITGISDLRDCGTLLVGQPSIDTLLATTSTASLLIAKDNGSFVRSSLEIRSARVTDTNHFWIAPATVQARLTQGMSGGHVTIKDQLAGFLLAVETSGSNEGAAKVLRIDRVSLLVSRLFENPSIATVDDATCLAPESMRTVRTTQSPSPVTRSNLADQSCGARVTAWSSPPISSSMRPENLVGSGGATGLWRTEAASDLTIDIRLCDTPTSTVSKIQLETLGCPAEDNVAYDIEAMVLGSAGSSISLGYAKMPIAGKVEIGGTWPVKGRDVRLRFVPRGQGKSPVCVGPLTVQ